jgi:hyaluronate lyase
VEVVANSAAVQAVSAPALGLKGANFWSAGSAAGMTSSGKAAVLVLEKDGKISVAVSDPTQLEKNVEVTLDAKAIKLVQEDARINVVSTSPIKLSVNLDGANGKTLVVEFQK